VKYEKYSAPDADLIPSRELQNLKQHYEHELDIGRKERQDIIQKCQEMS
jgi:hypothetical protein